MIKPKRERTCKYCGTKYKPYTSFQDNCLENECIIASNNKKKKKDYREAVSKFKAEDKASLRKDVQKIANRLGKLQDLIKGKRNCVTCGSFSNNQMDGGHAYPTSTYSPIRYYTLQIRNQCVKCNRFNGGSPREYRVYLLEELGEEKVLWLESHKGKITKKFTAEYLKKYKRVMGKRLRRQEKRYNKHRF